MSVFLAIDVPVSFDAIYDTLKHPSLSLARQPHITLRFFGDISIPEREEIRALASNIRSSAFTLTTTSSLGCFANWQRLRVLYVGVQPCKGLTQLNYCLHRVFGPAEHFVPHITVARVFGELEPDHIASLQHVSFASESFRVEELVLYESMNGTHKILKKIKLE